MAATTCLQRCANRSGLCCCMDEDNFESKPLAEVVQNDQRQCTDVPCCLILLGVLISQIFLIVYASQKGAQPEYLLYGYDYNGDLCNSENPDGQYAAWPNLYVSTSVQVCLTSCSQTQVTKEGGMIMPYTSTSFLGSYCLSDLTNTTSEFNDYEETYNRAVSDLYTSRWLMLICAFTGIILAFIYLRLVACIGRLLVWLTILGILIGGIMLSYQLFKVASDYDSDTEDDSIRTFEILLGVLVLLFMVMVLLGLFFMRKTITLSINMLNEASIAINDVKSTIIFPCIYSLFALAYIVFWVLVALYIYSVQTISHEPMPWSGYGYPDTYVYREFDSDLQNSLIWHFICLFFISQVICYFGYMVLSGTIADWYFSHWNSTNTAKVRGYETAQLSHSPLLESLFRILRFHLGTLAFGAMVVSFIRILRAVVMYLQKLSKNAQNPLTKCIFCSVNCCLACCQCVFDKISKEGFVFTTIYGTAFCYSSFHALKILLANITRTAMVEGISNLTETFGRLAIASLNTAFAVLVMMNLDYYVNNLSSILFPTLVIFICSYVTGGLFIMVFEVAVDTIFMCYLIDETVHKKPVFASKTLMGIADSSHQIVKQRTAPSEEKLLN